MADPLQKPEENIVIRTMQGDLGNKPRGASAPAEPKMIMPTPAPFASKEAEIKVPEFKPAPPAPILPKPAPFMPAPTEKKPPVLIIPPIPPKEIPKLPVKPLFKASPTWIKLGIIGFAIILLALSGLYGYWKLFVQSQPAPSPAGGPPVATTTIPTLPSAPSATTTAPIKFFNKLPHKTVTIDLPSKTPLALTEALKSEAQIDEALASVKQVKITYQGKPLTTSEFLGLMAIYTPQNFLDNYENEFIFAYFRQKEGARPVLILKAKDAGFAKIQVENWEKISMTSDIFPLFLSDRKLPSNLLSFRSYLFVGQPVRFLNVGIVFASLNYALYNNFLTFATSSAGMFVILQDLTGQTASAAYINALEASLIKFR